MKSRTLTEDDFKPAKLQYVFGNVLFVPKAYGYYHTGLYVCIGDYEDGEQFAQYHEALVGGNYIINLDN